MPRRVRSARGQMVDFDLIQIQQQLAATPPHPDVQARQDFIERRLRRRLRKVPAPAPKIEPEQPAAAPDLPGTEDLNEPQVLIDEVPVEQEEKKPARKTKTTESKTKTTRSRQKARPKTETKKETEE